jgi:hypothetical protein
MDTKAGWFDDLELAQEAARKQGKGILLQFHRDACAGCKKMDASTFPDPDVQRELIEWFVPVGQDILNNRGVRARYAAYWTPSFYFLDHHGKMLHHTDGYLGVEDFRIVMRLGKAALDLPRGKYLEVINLMDQGLELFPQNPRAASLLFTRGMAEYLLGKEKHAFRGAMKEIITEYPNSPEARMWPWTD